MYMKKSFSGLLSTLVIGFVGLISSSTAFASWSASCPYRTTNQCATFMHNPWQTANGTAVGSSYWHFSGDLAGGYHTVDIQVSTAAPQAAVTLDGFYYGTFPTQLVSAYMADGSFGHIVDYDEVMVFNILVNGTVYPVTLTAGLHGWSWERVPIATCVTISGSGPTCSII